MGVPKPQCGHEPGQAVGELRQAELIRWIGGPSGARPVPRHHGELVGQRLELGAPGAARVAHEPVHQDQRRPVPRAFVGDAESGHLDLLHGAPPSRSSRRRGSDPPPGTACHGSGERPGQPRPDSGRGVDRPVLLRRTRIGCRAVAGDASSFQGRAAAVGWPSESRGRGGRARCARGPTPGPAGEHAPARQAAGDRLGQLSDHELDAVVARSDADFATAAGQPDLLSAVRCTRRRRPNRPTAEPPRSAARGGRLITGHGPGGALTTAL